MILIDFYICISLLTPVCPVCVCLGIVFFRVTTPIYFLYNPFFHLFTLRYCLFHLFTLRYCQFSSPTAWLAMCIFDHANPKIFKHLLICMNLYQHAKTHLIPLVQSWNTVNFVVQRPDWSYPFLTMPHQKIFNQLLIFVNFYQLAKNEAVLSTSSGEIIYIKILQSDWLRVFCLYLKNKIFPK